MLCPYVRLAMCGPAHVRQCPHEGLSAYTRESVATCRHEGSTVLNSADERAGYAGPDRSAGKGGIRITDVPSALVFRAGSTALVRAGDRPRPGCIAGYRRAETFGEVRILGPWRGIRLLMEGERHGETDAHLDAPKSQRVNI